MLHQCCCWYSGVTFSKVPRKILGKLLILGATDTQVATSSRGYSATVEHCTNRPINSVQRSNRKLCSSSSNNSSSKIRSFPKIFLGTFENAVPDVHRRAWTCLHWLQITNTVLAYVPFSFTNFITSPLGGMQSIAIIMSLCLSISPLS